MKVHCPIFIQARGDFTSGHHSPGPEAKLDNWSGMQKPSKLVRYAEAQ